MPTAAMSRGVAPRGAQGFGHGGALRLPDFVRVVLDPAGAREVLREFALRQRDDPAAASNSSERELVVPWSSARMYLRGAHGAASSVRQPGRPRGFRPAAR